MIILRRFGWCWCFPIRSDWRRWRQQVPIRPDLHSWGRQSLKLPSATAIASQALNVRIVTFIVYDDLLINHFVTDYLFDFVRCFDHHFGEVLVFDYADAVMSFVLIKSLFPLRWSWFCPLFLFFTRYNQSIIDQLGVSEPSYFFRLEGSMSGEILNGTGKDVKFDSHVIDWVNWCLLSTISSMTVATSACPVV